MREKMTKTEPVKPIALEVAEAEEELFAFANKLLQDHHLPLFMAEPIFAKLYEQIRQGKQNEIAMARSTYEGQLAEFRKATADELEKMEREEG